MATEPERHGGQEAGDLDRTGSDCAVPGVGPTAGQATGAAFAACRGTTARADTAPESRPPATSRGGRAASSGVGGAAYPAGRGLAAGQLGSRSDGPGKVSRPRSWRPTPAE